MKINLDDVDGDEYAVNIQCVRAVDLRRGAVLLLNTHAARSANVCTPSMTSRSAWTLRLPLRRHAGQ